MTTEIVKYKNFVSAAEMDGAYPFVSLDLYGHANEGNANDYTEAVLVLSSEDGYEELKWHEFIENHKNEKEGWQRTMSNTLSLLKNAQCIIDNAEKRISDQEVRIAHLEKQATIDDLTGIQNRRGFYEEFTRELNRCERSISSGGLLVLIDLDNFKSINDTYGHQAGDACLRLVASELQDHIRVMDVAARLGGDEFVLLLSNTTKAKAASRAQTLAWRLNHLSMAWYGEEIPVRASLGLRSFEAGDSVDRIFNDADMHLYSNKKAGKAKKEQIIL
jgi:diguanylate cyclase (GGDEF)-like protein